MQAKNTPHPFAQYSESVTHTISIFLMLNM